MKIETLNITDVKPLENNPRFHPEKQLGELARSIEQFGQYRPIVIDENDTILAGNGLHTALTQAGYTTIEAYRVTGLTEQQKTKLILADNKTGTMSIDDFEVVEELLKTLDDFEVPGYDEELVRELVADDEVVLQMAEQYGYIDEEAREKYVATSPQQRAHIDEANEAAQATIGNPPPPPSREDLEAEARQNYSRPATTCPKCGHSW